MTTRDTFNNLSIVNALDTQVISSDTTTDGEVIDTQGFESLTFSLKSGAYTDGTYTPVIEESDEVTFGGEENAVADGDLIGTEADAALSAANTLSKIGYRGSKRYVRLTIVSASTSSGATIGASAIKGHAHDNKV